MKWLLRQRRLRRYIDYMERAVDSAVRAIECEEIGDGKQAAKAAEECEKWLHKATGIGAIYRQRDLRAQPTSPPP